MDYMVNNFDSFFVPVSNKYYNNVLSNEELVIYVLVKRNFSSAKELSVVSIDMLCKLLKINMSKNVRAKNKILDAINALVQKEILTCYDLNYKKVEFKNVKKDIFLIQSENTTKNYFKVYDASLDKIIEYAKDKKLDTFALCRYYFAICRVCNCNSMIGYLSSTSVTFINNKKTCYKYNKILQDLKLIKYNTDFITAKQHNIATYFTTNINIDNNKFKQYIEAEAISKGYIHV